VAGRAFPGSVLHLSGPKRLHVNILIHPAASESDLYMSVCERCRSVEETY
jgi:hypothetical protein